MTDDAAREVFSKPGNVTVAVPENTPQAVLEQLSAIMQNWQEKLDFYCTVERSGQKTAQTEDAPAVTLFQLQGSYNSPGAYLEKLYYPNPEYSNLLYRARRSGTTEESVSLFKAAEQMLRTEAIFLPLSSGEEYFFFSEKFPDLQYNPFNRTIVF